MTICPDLDTVTYNLAGINNLEQGLGAGRRELPRAGASYTLRRRAGSAWATAPRHASGAHQTLKSGATLTEVTFEAKTEMGIRASILPMSDQPVRTLVHTDEGVLRFRTSLRAPALRTAADPAGIAGIGAAPPSPAVMSALNDAAAVVLCPSNRISA